MQAVRGHAVKGPATQASSSVCGNSHLFLGRESAADSEGDQNRNLSLGGFHCDRNLPLDSRHARIGLLAGLFKGRSQGVWRFSKCYLPPSCTCTHAMWQKFGLLLTKSTWVDS